MPEWRSRLAVSYTKGPDTFSISPIDSFTPSFALGVEPLNSCENTHIGAIYTPQSVTFSMTVKAIGDVVGRLTKLAVDGTVFDVTLQEGEGTDWSVASIVLRNCIITSCTPSSATISGAPAATFSGFSLSADVDAKVEDLVTVP
jgi:hypothetical protein